MITQKEELTISVKPNGNIEVAKQPIFYDAEEKQVAIGERWRIAIIKDDIDYYFSFSLAQNLS